LYFGITGLYCSGVFDDFLDSCITIEDAAQAILAQGDHTQLDGLLAEHDGRRTLIDEGADGIVDDLDRAAAAPREIRPEKKSERQKG
jgi:hypothetical protein